MQRTLALLIFFNVCFITATDAQRNDFWNINFFKADSIAEVYADRDLKNPEKLAEDLTQHFTTDVEKFRAIFRWVTDNIYYDLDLYHESKNQQLKLRYKRKRLIAWQKRFIKRMEHRLYTKKRTICDGYATLLERMSTHVGISCKKITGYGRTIDQEIGKGSVNHAWNAVRIDSKWYLCDATWASSSLDPSTMRFHRRFNKSYFLTDPSLFIANHYPQDTSWTLLYNKPSRKQFLDAPIKHSAFISNQINTYHPLEGIVRAKKDSVVTFNLTFNGESNELYARPYISIAKAGSKQEITKKVAKDSNGVYILEYVFKEAGKYIADVIINGQYSMTYTIYVR
jgi:transglutaminase/protease-like cytokinesis protein 3